MKTMRYDGETYQVAETADEFIKMLEEGDVIISNRKFDGDASSYYCGDVPSYTYSDDKVGETPDGYEENYPLRKDVKGWYRNADDLRNAIAQFPDLELDVWREETATRFFFNANGADLEWHFEV